MFEGVVTTQVCGVHWCCRARSTLAGNGPGPGKCHQIIAADGSYTVLAPRNEYRIVPRVLPRSHSCLRATRD
jgi:hypothetical protein